MPKLPYSTDEITDSILAMQAVTVKETGPFIETLLDKALIITGDPNKALAAYGVTGTATAINSLTQAALCAIGTHQGCEPHELQADKVATLKAKYIYAVTAAFDIHIKGKGKT